MDISKVTISQLFERPRRYLVPLFQRRYVWTESDQWEPLWEDIASQADALAHSRTAAGSTPRQHVMGAVVLGRERTGIREVPTSLLIDGQQRMTTLSVLLAALRDMAASLGNDFMAQSLQRLLANPEPLQSPVEAYKVWPTHGDQVAFMDAMSLRGAQEIEAKYPLPKRRPRKGDRARPPIVDAYLYFSRSIANFIGEVATDVEAISGSSTPEHVERRATDLFDALTRHLQFVVIELDEEEDPQVIFETLNARGVPLLPSDLIRNFLFLNAERQDGDPQQLYDTFWQPFDADWTAPGEKRPFWQEMTKQGRLKRPRIDLFLFHYTTLSARQEIRVDHLFTEFRAWWNQEQEAERRPIASGLLANGERAIASELARIARFAGHFRLVQFPDPGTRVGRFASRLKAVDTFTVFPLVLSLLDRARSLGSDDIDASLRDLESYLIRRMTCGLTSKGYNQVFLELLRHLADDDDFRSARIREWLSSLTAVSDRWPSDAEFSRAWLEDPLYARLKPARVCMLLEAIEQASRSEFQETQEVPRGLTVEHLLPQNPQAGDYPFPQLPSLRTEEQLEQRARLIHSMGNLTLLTMKLNKSVSNGPWSLKRPKIAMQSLLLLSRYCDRPDVLTGWNEDDIRARGNELLATALGLWPGPGSYRATSFHQ